MVRMKLFDAGWAPSPRRVRIFLAEKGVEVETVSIDLRTDEQLAPAYLAVNPRGTVPTLILDNGTVIDEIGRAHVCTPVTNANLVCRLLIEKKKNNSTSTM